MIGCFFSPSKLLKEYLAEAMRKEGLANTSEKVWNWTDYCRMILQENYHLLEMKGSNAPFKACKISDTLFYQNSDIINVFTKFYLGELRTIKSQLPQLNSEGKVYAWTNIALKIQERFDETDDFDLPRFVSLFNALESLYGNDCKELLRNRSVVLSELANEICDLLSEHNEQRKDIENIFDLTSDDSSDIPEDEYNDENEENCLLLKNKGWESSESSNKRLATKIQKWLKVCNYSANMHKVSFHA